MISTYSNTTISSGLDNGDFYEGRYNGQLRISPELARSIMCHTTTINDFPDGKITSINDRMKSKFNKNSMASRSHDGSNEYDTDVIDIINVEKKSSGLSFLKLFGHCPSKDVQSEDAACNSPNVTLQGNRRYHLGMKPPRNNRLLLQRSYRYRKYSRMSLHCQNAVPPPTVVPHRKQVEHSKKVSAILDTLDLTGTSTNPNKGNESVHSGTLIKSELDYPRYQDVTENVKSTLCSKKKIESVLNKIPSLQSKSVTFAQCNEVIEIPRRCDYTNEQRKMMHMSKQEFELLIQRNRREILFRNSTGLDEELMVLVNTDYSFEDNVCLPKSSTSISNSDSISLYQRKTVMTTESKLHDDTRSIFCVTEALADLTFPIGI